jgi:ABC-type nitrate/sulfonate/bicarbonate transport system substrate-binding protein
MRTFRARLIATLGAAGVLGMLPSIAAAQVEEIKIGYYPGAVMTIPSWIAEAKGFYSTAGLKATLIPVASGPIMSSNTASGAIDAGYNSTSNVGLTLERGFEQTILMGNMRTPIVLLARSDVPIANPGKYPDNVASLKGLNWGSFGRGSDIENIMRVMLKDAKVNPDNGVTWIGVGPPATGLPALEAKRIEVYGTTMPAAEVAVAAGFGRIVVDLRKGEGPAGIGDVVYSVLLARADRVAQQPQLFKKLLNAHTRSICWLKNPGNLEEAASILREKMPVKNLSDAQYKSLVSESIRLMTVHYTKDMLAPWNKLMTEGGILKRPIPASVIWKEAPSSEPDCTAFNRS